MIKISKLNQIYSEKLNNNKCFMKPWSFHIEIHSTTDMKQIYEDNKREIKDYLSSACMILGSVPFYTIYIEKQIPHLDYGDTIMSLNYTITKNPNVDLKQPFDTTKWRCIDNDVLNSHQFGYKTEEEYNNYKRRVEKVKKLKELANDPRLRLAKFGIKPKLYIPQVDIWTYEKKKMRHVEIREKKITSIKPLIETIGTIRYVSKFLSGIKKHKNMRILLGIIWTRILISRKLMRIRKKRGDLIVSVGPGRKEWAFNSKSLNKTPRHIQEYIKKAIKNGFSLNDSYITVVQNTNGLWFKQNNELTKFTKHKNYKNPRKQFKTSSGEINCVYDINIDSLHYIANLTKHIKRAKHPLNLNKRSKFCHSIITHCKFIYEKRDYVQLSFFQLCKVCWRAIDVITFFRDVLYEFQ